MVTILSHMLFVRVWLTITTSSWLFKHIECKNDIAVKRANTKSKWYKRRILGKILSKTPMKRMLHSRCNPVSNKLLRLRAPLSTNTYKLFWPKVVRKVKTYTIQEGLYLILWVYTDISPNCYTMADRYSC